MSQASSNQAVSGLLGSIGRAIIAACSVLGGMTLLQWRIVIAMIPPSFDFDETVRQLYKVGVKSVVIVITTAAFVGAIMVIQTGGFIRSTGTMSLLGWGAGTAVLSEVGPVLIGLMFSGRVGANNTAELGTMVITDQIDAIKLLGMDPIRYLVVPRFVTMILMLVLLTAVGDFFALVGGGVAATLVLGVDLSTFWQSIFESHLVDEYVMGIVKGFFFGGAISVVSCHFGLNVSGGAKGVGQAVNQSVVTAAIAIFVVNYLVTTVWL